MLVSVAADAAISLLYRIPLIAIYRSEHNRVDDRHRLLSAAANGTKGMVIPTLASGVPQPTHIECDSGYYLAAARALKCVLRKVAVEMSLPEANMLLVKIAISLPCCMAAGSLWRVRIICAV
jgi:hypothetical protein